MHAANADSSSGCCDGALSVIKLSQAAAARYGDIERLQELYSEAGQWWEETAEAALAEGQLDTFYWLRTHKPSCPWSAPLQEWALDMHTRERISDLSLRTAGSHASKLRAEETRRMRSSLLSMTLEHAAACASQPERLFFDDVLVQMLDAAHCQGSLVMALSWAIATAAEGGLELTTKWLLRYSGSLGACNEPSPASFAAAAKAGQLGTLALLLEARQQRPLGCCTWDHRCGIEACDNNQRPVLEWLRAHKYPWTLECTRRAAYRGDIKLLEWMRRQSQPWPWDSSVCTAAKRQPAALRWLLDQTPACPWTAYNAAMCPEALVDLDNVGLLERLHLPEFVLPQLCQLAAREEKLQLLKWLAQQQPTCQMGAVVCEQALARDQVKVVHFLVAELKPPVFPGLTYLQYYSLVIPPSGGCMLVLAQAACPMESHHVPQLNQLVESWYTFMGLQRWAANQVASSGTSAVANALAEPNEERCHEKLGPTALCGTTPNDSSQADSDPQQLAATHQSNTRVVNGLLAHMAQLPDELASKIASYAFLSPLQASKVQITARPAQPASWYHETWGSLHPDDVIGYYEYSWL